jgi:hypothetical protein
VVEAVWLEHALKYNLVSAVFNLSGIVQFGLARRGVPQNMYNYAILRCILGSQMYLYIIAFFQYMVMISLLSSKVYI